MAKFNASGVGGDIRGKLGNSVFSRNKGGAIIRQKVTPNNPKTASQQQVRQNFGQNSKAWSGTLTQDQRNAWTAFAAANPVNNVFGNSITLTGLAMYNRLNQVLLQIGAAVISDPPVAYSVEQLPGATALSVDSDGGELDVILTTAAGSVSSATSYYIFATPGLAPGKTPNQSLYRFVAAMPAGSSIGGSIDITTPYQTKFGLPSAGTQVWCDVAQVNNETGALLTGVPISTIVT